MSNFRYTIMGTILNETTIKLDEALPIRSTKVRVTIEPIDGPQPNHYSEVMAEIRQRQKAHNHQPPSPAEVEEYLRGERDSWLK